MEHRYAALVRGSSAIFPRGYLWLIPVWYAGIAALLEIKDKAAVVVRGLRAGRHAARGAHAR